MEPLRAVIYSPPHIELNSCNIFKKLYYKIKGIKREIEEYVDSFAFIAEIMCKILGIKVETRIVEFHATGSNKAPFILFGNSVIPKNNILAFFKSIAMHPQCGLHEAEADTMLYSILMKMHAATMHIYSHKTSLSDQIITHPIKSIKNRINMANVNSLYKQSFGIFNTMQACSALTETNLSLASLLNNEQKFLFSNKITFVDIVACAFINDQICLLPELTILAKLVAYQKEVNSYISAMQFPGECIIKDGPYFTKIVNELYAIN